MKNKKPQKCCYPDCFSCPYADCRYDRLEVEDFTETNNRDYFLYKDSTGNALHQKRDTGYRNARQTAYNRRRNTYRDRHDYNQQYYAEHGEEIKAKMRESYCTEDNTNKCRKYRKNHSEQEKVRQRSYYLENREKRLEYAKRRYQEKNYYQLTLDDVVEEQEQHFGNRKQLMDSLSLYGTALFLSSSIKEMDKSKIENADYWYEFLSVEVDDNGEKI